MGTIFWSLIYYPPIAIFSSSKGSLGTQTSEGSKLLWGTLLPFELIVNTLTVSGDLPRAPRWPLMRHCGIWAITTYNITRLSEPSPYWCVTMTYIAYRFAHLRPPLLSVTPIKKVNNWSRVNMPGSPISIARFLPISAQSLPAVSLAGTFG